jgi:formylglycine-generating enzyme required for sulfatase activity
MHGNVWQWCSDAMPGVSLRVIRGGSWIGPGSFCQAANRDWHAGGDRFYFLGFRLARVPVR